MRRAVASEVVCGLQVEPELRRRVEGLGKKPGGFGCDTALPANELVDPLDGNTQVLRESHLRLAYGAEELRQENLSRVSRNATLRLHGYPL